MSENSLICDSQINESGRFTSNFSVKTSNTVLYTKMRYTYEGSIQRKNTITEGGCGSPHVISVARAGHHCCHSHSALCSTQQCYDGELTAGVGLAIGQGLSWLTGNHCL